MNGRISFIPLYWEWLEDVLIRCNGLLNDANLSEAVLASLFMYDYKEYLMEAFCECWSPMTNTLHTLVGEISITMWDLHKLGGLPIRGLFFDEVLLIAKKNEQQNICHWTPTFTKCFHKMFIVIIREQGSENSFTMVGIIKESLTLTEHIFQPFPI